MSLLALTCAAALNASGPCGSRDLSSATNPDAVKAVLLSDEELAGVHGRGLPIVGLTQAGPAGSAHSITIADVALRCSTSIRDVVDNWTLDVAVPLILAATSAR